MGKLTHSVSGSVASFKSMDRSDISHLKAYFTPVQEEGYPSPIYLKPITGWTGLTVYHSNENLNPVRNLYDISSVTFGKWTSNTGDFFDAVYGCISKRIPVNSGDVINAQVFGNTVYSKSLVFYNSDGSFNTRYHNTGNTTLSCTSPIKGFVALQVAKGIGDYDIIDSQYLEDAQIVLTINSMPTEYIAYIGPTIPVTFPVVGKNKFPNPAGTRSDIDLVAGVTYTVSTNVASTPYFKAYYEDGTESGYVWLNGTVSGERHSNTFTPTKHVVSGFFFISGYEMTECQIEEGNIFTSYEAYSSNNTVFGGYVDLVTGELVETHKLAVLNDSSKWMQPSGQSYFLYSAGVSDRKKNTKTDFLCNSFVVANSADSGTPYMRFPSNTTTGLTITINGSSLTLNDVKTLSANGNIIICYELAEPIVHTMTPSQLKCLVGQNNIWSSANGNVEVEYEFTDYLAKKRMMMQEHRLLPPTYRQVEYLQSNSNGEYINTGYKGNMGICVETRFNMMVVTQGNPVVIGNRIGNARFSFPVYYNGFDLAINTDVSSGSGDWVLKHIYNATISTVTGSNVYASMTVTDDDEFNKTVSNTNNVNNDIDLYMFQNHYINNGVDGIDSNRATLRIYYLKLYDGGIGDQYLVRHFIPCVRAYDNEPGMYDLVTRRFFTNQGNGAFTAATNKPYPIGTDIIEKYIGRDSNGYFIGQQNVDINSSGEFVEGNGYYGSPTYVPIEKNFVYEKNAKRIYKLTFYDENKNFISQLNNNTYNSRSIQTITNIPSNARYIRFLTHSANTNWELAITRV